MRDTVANRLCLMWLRAGSSALLLTAAHSDHAALLSLCAFAPFLQGTRRSRPLDLVASGLLLALAYAIASAKPLLLSPAVSLPPLLLLAACLSLYALVVRCLMRATRYWLLPALAAWIPLHCLLVWIDPTASLLLPPLREQGLATRIASLFGLSVVAALVLLVNWLLLAFVQNLITSPLRNRPPLRGSPLHWNLPFSLSSLHFPQYFFPSPRSPPLIARIDNSPETGKRSPCANVLDTRFTPVSTHSTSHHSGINNWKEVQLCCSEVFASWPPSWRPSCFSPSVPTPMTIRSDTPTTRGK